MSLKQIYQAVNVNSTIYYNHVVPELVLRDYFIQGII